MEREKAWPDTAAPPGRREGESLTSESGGIEYRCGCAGGLARSSGEVPAVAVGVERRGQVIRGMFVRSTGLRSGRSRVSGLKSSGKPFEISKAEVWQAWEKVKDNKGASGVDGCSIEDFEADLKNNLYKIWNRMSSGSYFPPPVRAVEIPKPHGGGTRMLGVPCVSDRVAQTVVARRLEGKVEAIFHSDSYGYRPGRSPEDAVEVCRRRCWKRDWVIDLDIEKFFDSVPRDLIVKAVEANTDLPWVVLYVTRWLQAPVQNPDGSRLERNRGTPQGSSVSPVLANLFLHYAFDAWLAREFPSVTFERYVDDAVVHCVIHIPLERDARKFPGQPRIERIMEEQISQHRRHRRPLRGPPVSFQHAPVGILYRRLEPPCHIQDHPRQVGIGLHRLDDEVTRDGVEELLDVKINHPVALPAPPLAHLNRILRRPPRTIAVRVRMEDRLDLPLQSPRYHRLGHPIGHARHS